MTLRPVLLVSLAALSLAGCHKQAESDSLSLHEVMAGTIDPSADVIWNVGSKSYGADGGPQIGLLNDQEWKKIADAADKLHEGAAYIADHQDIAVVKPGMKILDEGVHPEAITAKQVTGYVEADRPGLVARARELAALSVSIRNAAIAKDAAVMIRDSEQLDEVCESCHKKFWYPALKAARPAAK